MPVVSCLNDCTPLPDKAGDQRGIPVWLWGGGGGKIIKENTPHGSAASRAGGGVVV